jgi:hypothetical protein
MFNKERVCSARIRLCDVTIRDTVRVTCDVTTLGPVVVGGEQAVKRAVQQC